MLILLGDLHLGDGTAEGHPAHPDTLRRQLRTALGAAIRRRRPQALTIVLLGDVFDLVRSTRWFEFDGRPFDPAECPWGERGRTDVVSPRPDSPTEARCLDILGRWPADGRRESMAQGTILHRHWATLALFRELGGLVAAELGQTVPVVRYYLPGNHDRLANVYPSVRDTIRQALGLGPAALGAGPAGAWFPVDLQLTDYGVLARHGHLHDRWNHAHPGDGSWEAHREPTVGDVLAAEFAVRLPWLVGRRWDGPAASAAPVTHALWSMHDVRPVTAVADWLDLHLAEAEGRLGRTVGAALADVLRDLARHEFLRKLAAPPPGWLAVRGMLSLPGARLLTRQAMVALPPSRTLSYALRRSAWANTGQAAYAAAARAELVAADDPHLRFVVYGHTHVVGRTALHLPGGEHGAYVNPGAWQATLLRTRRGGMPCFVPAGRGTLACFEHRDAQPADAAGRRSSALYATPMAYGPPIPLVA